MTDPPGEFVVGRALHSPPLCEKEEEMKNPKKEENPTIVRE